MPVPANEQDLLKAFSSQHQKCGEAELGREGATVDLAMEKAQGKMHQNPEQSVLASLSNPQVTLLSVQKRCTFRRSSGLGSSARSESSEEKSPPQPEEELSPGVLARTLERRSQVSAVEPN